MSGSGRRALIEARLENVLTDAHFPDLPGRYARGKVRDNYDLDDGRRIIVATDRQSAFDRILAAVPFKGQVLTQTARFWFEATADIAPNHALAYPDPNVLFARTLRMLPVEIVVRDYLTGTTATSIWTMYASGERQMYGLRLPEGLRRHQKLPQTVLTPTTKAEALGHDLPLSPAEVVTQGLVTDAQWQALEAGALALFSRGKQIAAANGLILVDTKYEFGVDEAGRITLADEIHTPDSSRYWLASSYAERFEAGLDPESLDKDFLRRWIAARCDPYREPIPQIPQATLVEFAERYITLFETVTGLAFEPPDEATPVRERILGNIRRAL
jgi:phosphoribosylaminoimidazole-succinocarboxamide synthase